MPVVGVVCIRISVFPDFGNYRELSEHTDIAKIFSIQSTAKQLSEKPKKKKKKRLN